MTNNNNPEGGRFNLNDGGMITFQHNDYDERYGDDHGHHQKMGRS